MVCYYRRYLPAADRAPLHGLFPFLKRKKKLLHRQQKPMILLRVSLLAEAGMFLFQGCAKN